MSSGASHSSVSHGTAGHGSGVGAIESSGEVPPILELGPGTYEPYSGGSMIEFQALCGGARSYADYVDLARRFHTVMLSGVPRMSPKNADAARRFTWLVDIFYDDKVNLIVSAEAEPEDLFTGGNGDRGQAVRGIGERRRQTARAVPRARRVDRLGVQAGRLQEAGHHQALGGRLAGQPLEERIPVATALLPDHPKLQEKLRPVLRPVSPPDGPEVPRSIDIAVRLGIECAIERCDPAERLAVLRVDVNDPRDGKVRVAVGKRPFAGNERIRRVPDHLKRRVIDGSEQPRGFPPCGDVARVLVFDADDQPPCMGQIGKLAEGRCNAIEARAGIDRPPVREDAHDPRAQDQGLDLVVGKHERRQIETADKQAALKGFRRHQKIRERFDRRQPLEQGLGRAEQEDGTDPVRDPVVAWADDGGATWRLWNEGISATQILDLVLDPGDPSRLYAATDGGGLARVVSARARARSRRRSGALRPEPGAGPQARQGQERLHRAPDRLLRDQQLPRRHRTAAGAADVLRVRAARRRQAGRGRCTVHQGLQPVAGFERR